jgi:hypothetical protein
MILKEDKNNKYTYQLTCLKKQIKNLKPMLDMFRNDPDRHCVIKELHKSKTTYGYAVFTNGEYIDRLTIMEGGNYESNENEISEVLSNS